MSLFPTSHSWNLSHYARRSIENSLEKNHFVWLCLDSRRTSLNLIITATLQLIVLSSERCVEEMIDIWLMNDSLHVHVHRRSVLFYYKWPVGSSSNTSRRCFRVQFENNEDLHCCLKFLSDFFPIDVYSSSNVEEKLRSTRPNENQWNSFRSIKDTMLIENSPTVHFRADFIRQFLSTCLLDPAFFILVNQTEQILKTFIEEK